MWPFKTKKRKTLIIAIEQKPRYQNPIMEQVMTILDDMELNNWEFSQHTAKHKSGITFWLSNCPYADMNIYQPFEYEFSRYDADILRKKLYKLKDKIIINLINQNNDGGNKINNTSNAGTRKGIKRKGNEGMGKKA